jgi:hypothetical protein
MKKLIAIAVVLAALAPVVGAQTAATSFTGKWEGTFTRQRDDGTQEIEKVEFNLTHKGKELTGTAGPPERQWPIEKGEVNAGKATFQVQQPNGGPLFKFALTIVKDRLQGDMTGERDGVVRGQAKVDAAKAK